MLGRIPHQRRRLQFSLAVVAFCLAACACKSGAAGITVETVPSADNSQMEQELTVVEKGIWGGVDIAVSVNEKDVTIEFSCADGEIGQELKKDRDGRFSVEGVFIPVTPGPIRVDREPVRRSARYEGAVSGSEMTLKITLIDDNEDIGIFVVVLGKMARVHRCK